MKNDTKKKAVVYLRTATKENNGIDKQREVCLQYAAKNDYIVVDTYIDFGISGMSANKYSAYEEMINRLRVDPDIEAVIIRDISRISRNLTLYFKRKEDIKSLGKKIVSATEPFVGENSPASNLMEMIMVGFVAFQRNRPTKSHCSTCARSQRTLGARHK